MRREKEEDNERGRKERRNKEDQDCTWEPR